MTKVTSVSKFIAGLFVLALSVAPLNLARASIVVAAPRAQATPAAASPTPTDEPPKAPYVFPTPIFIPTYPGDTAAATTVPRSAGQPTGQDTYTVQSGDSPWSIAQKVYGDGTKYTLIMSANGITDSSRLRVGMVLKIPPLAGANPQPSAPASTPSASIPIAPALQPTAAPPGSPTIAATPTRTPTSAGILPGSVVDAMQLVVTVLTGALALGGLLAAISALLLYIRARRLQQLNTPRKWLQFRQ
jgi:LysM repeat protein